MGGSVRPLGSSPGLGHARGAGTGPLGSEKCDEVQLPAFVGKR